MTFFNILWFILIAVLWIAYLVLEGFDFGVGMLMKIVAKNDAERTQAIKTIGPHWDGNEVWLLTAGGATFAAFPHWYATMFSGMYLALFVLLVLLIIRISALEWRSKIATVKWRSVWDTLHFVAALLVPLLLGVAFSNLVQGMKIEFVTRARAGVPGHVIPAGQMGTYTLADGAYQFTGGFFSLLTPYTILGGLVLVAVCLAHGAQFLALKTEGALRERTNASVGPLTIVETLLAAVWVVWGQLAYSSNIWSWIPLVIAALSLIAAAAFSQKQLRSEGKAFIFSTLGIAAAVAWIFSSMAPSVMKSSISPLYSLTIANASSTTSTLILMTIVTVVILPFVLVYTVWSYRVFKARISLKDVEINAGLLPKPIRGGANFLAG